MRLCGIRNVASSSPESGSDSLAPSHHSSSLSASSSLYALVTLPMRLATTVLGACISLVTAVLDACLWVAVMPMQVAGSALDSLTTPLTWLSVILGVAPSQLIGGAGSWLAASMWLHRSAWEYPIVCGAFVALGMQEVVEFVGVLLPWEGSAHDP